MDARAQTRRDTTRNLIEAIGADQWPRNGALVFGAKSTTRCWGPSPIRAKTYAKDPLKRAISAGFCTFEGKNPVLARTVRRCME